MDRHNSVEDSCRSFTATRVISGVSCPVIVTSAPRLRRFPIPAVPVASRHLFGCSVTMDYDDDLRDRLGVAAFTAILDASTPDGGGPPLVNTGAAFDGLLMAAAVIIARSPECDTPQKVRKLAEASARKLRQQILAAQIAPNAPGFGSRLN
jgi:hypothetical protein